MQCSLAKKRGKCAPDCSWFGKHLRMGCTNQPTEIRFKKLIRKDKVKTKKGDITFCLILVDLDYSPHNKTGQRQKGGYKGEAFLFVDEITEDFSGINHQPATVKKNMLIQTYLPSGKLSKKGYSYDNLFSELLLTTQWMPDNKKLAEQEFDFAIKQIQEKINANNA